jgi:hypothetical protein
MMLARVLVVVSCGILLTNCARQIDTSRFALSRQDGPSFARHIARTKTDDDGTPLKAVAVGIPTSSVERPGVSDFTYLQMHSDNARAPADVDGLARRGTIRASMTVGEPAVSSAPSGPNFLETLAKDDKEHQTLKSKTLICHGC